MARGVPARPATPPSPNGKLRDPAPDVNDVVHTNGEHIRSIPKYSKVALMIFSWILMA